MPSHEIKARFIEPMLLQRTQSLPDGPGWSYEVKLDGYRALAIKTSGKILLRSRNNKDFNAKYPGVAKALGTLPDETVIDGEVVALDESGRPSFNLLQNVGPSKATVVYYVFDVLVLAGRNVMAEPLSTRRRILQSQVLPRLREPVRESPQLEASLAELVKAVRAHGFEGIVAKRLDSLYEPGQRIGAWRKMRISRGQEFVIGGYTPSPARGTSTHLSSGTTKGTSSSMLPGPATGLRQLPERSYIAGSIRWKSRNAPFPTCQSHGAGAGGRA